MVSQKRHSRHYWKSSTVVLLAMLVTPGAIKAASYTSVVVYGDSLSDNGNLSAATGLAGAPYFNGRLSNGPVAVEQLSAGLGVPLVDYAWAGATTGIGNIFDDGSTTTLGSARLPGMLTEFNQSQQSIASNLGSLFVVWGGPNDFHSLASLTLNPQQTISTGVSNIITLVNGLLSRGVTNVLVPGMPDLGLTPYVNSFGPLGSTLGTAVSDAFNSALIAQLPSSAKYVDTSNLLRTIVANPTTYGFTNVTDACFNGSSICADPSKYLFFDDLHPTTQGHALVAQQLLAATNANVPEPGTFAMVAGVFFLAVAFRQHHLSQLRRSQIK